MPNLAKQIPKTMRERGVPEEILGQFRFPETNDPTDVMALINQMDRLLSKDECLRVMEEQGCCKTGAGAKAHREFGLANKGKSLEEKVALLNETQMPHNAPCHLNSDHTLSVYWGNDGMGKRCCPCGFTRKLPDSFDIPLTFCGCCGGHIRSNYQKSLGVKLRLKEIVSSSSNSKGEKRCEFLFDWVKAT